MTFRTWNLGRCSFTGRVLVIEPCWVIVVQHRSSGQASQHSLSSILPSRRLPARIDTQSTRFPRALANRDLDHLSTKPMTKCRPVGEAVPLAAYEGVVSADCDRKTGGWRRTTRWQAEPWHSTAVRTRCRHLLGGGVREAGRPLSSFLLRSVHCDIAPLRERCVIECLRRLGKFQESGNIGRRAPAIFARSNSTTCRPCQTVVVPLPLGQIDEWGTTMMGRVIAMLCALGLLMSNAWAGETQILKRAPQEGGLRPGERVLVDDGSCPKGRIREIVGGGNRSYSSTGDRTGGKRTERCIRV